MKTTITNIPNLYQGYTPSSTDYSFEDLCDLFKQSQLVTDKDQVPLYSTNLFKSEGYVLSKKGHPSRGDINVIHHTALLIDVDAKYSIDEYLAMMEAWPCHGILYSTFNHQVSKNGSAPCDKYRIIIPYDKAMPVHVKKELNDKICSIIDADPASVKSSQPFYFPSHSKTNAHSVRFEVINPDKGDLDWETFFEYTPGVIAEKKSQTFKSYTPTQRDNRQYLPRDTIFNLQNGGTVRFDSVTSKISNVYCPNPNHGSDSKGSEFLSGNTTHSWFVCKKCKTFHIEAIKKEVPKDNLLIPIGGKLSDISNQIDLTQNTLLISPTNSGKSTLIFNQLVNSSNKVTIVVPTIALAIDLSKSRDVDVFCDGKYSLDMSKSHVTTYASLAKYCKNAGDVSNRILVLDEVHTFVTNIGYQHDQYEMAKGCISKFKSFIGLTATPIWNCLPELKFDRTITVDWTVKPTKTFTRLLCDDLVINSTTTDILVKKSLGVQSLVFLNNTSEKRDALTSRLASLGLTYAIIDSQAKESESWYNIVNEGSMAGVDVIVSTCVLKEGVSIIEHSKDIAIYAIGQWHPIELEQMANRPRRASSIELILPRKNDETSLNTAATEVNIDFTKAREAELHCQNTITAALNVSISAYAKVLTKEHAANRINSLSDGVNAININPITLRDGVYSVDMLTLGYKMFKYEQEVCSRYFHIMDQKLIDLGWTYTGTRSTKINTDLSECAESDKVRRAELKANETAFFDNISKYTKYQFVNLLEAINNGAKEVKLTKSRQTSIIRINEVLRNMDLGLDNSIEKAVTFYRNELATPKKWQIYIGRTEQRRIVSDPKVSKAQLREVSDVYKKFSIGERITKEEITRRVRLIDQKYKKNCEIEAGSVITRNDYDAEMYLTRFFEIELQSTRVDGKTIEIRVLTSKVLD